MSSPWRRPNCSAWQKRDFDALLARNSAISGAFYKNCLEVTFSRFRNIIANFAFSQHTLRQKSTRLDELNRDLSLAEKIQSYFINRELLDNRTHSCRGSAIPTSTGPASRSAAIS